MKNIRLTTALALLFAGTLSVAAQTTDSVRTAKSAVADSARYALGEATVTATRLVFVTKKDTIIYDMDALGASKGDMLGDVINRMPGLELRGGTLYFKGRPVSRLLVNGYDFQHGDTKRALENLPAYIIKNIKAYEGDTDQHRITGLDDGVKEQVVDVILRKEYLGTWTGNVDLGYGTDERYRYRGFANTFTDNMRISAYAGYTNTGQYQSTNSKGDWSDNGGAGSGSGNTRYLMPGLSAMWHNKVSRDSVGYFYIDFSFNYDYRGHKDAMTNGSETYLDDNSSSFNLSRSKNKNDEKILSPQFSLEWRPWKGFYGQVSAQYNYQTQTDRESAQSGTWSADVAKTYESPLDSLVANAATGFPLESAVNLTRTESGYSNKNNSVYTSFYLTQKLTASNLRLSARGVVQYQHQKRTSNDLSAYDYYQTSTSQLDPLYNRFRDSHHNYTYSQTFVDLNVPVPFFNTLRFTYGYEYTKNYSDTQGFRLERVGDIYAQYADYVERFGTLPTTVDWQQTARDAEITLNSNTLSRRHWAEVQLQYDKHNLYASLQNTVKFYHDELDYVKGDYEPLHPKRNATSYLLNAKVRYTTSKAGRYTLGYFFQRTPADISNYVDIPDYSDPLNVRLGSEAFKTQAYQKLSAQYELTMRHARTLFIETYYGRTDNNTVTRSTYDKLTGVSTSQAVNVSGAWNYTVNANYTFMAGKKKRANFSIQGYYQLDNTPSYSMATSGEPVLRNDKTNTAQLSVNGNFSFNNIYFGLTPTINYMRNRSSLANVSGTELCTANYTGYFDWKLPLDFEFSTNVNVRHYITSTARQFDNVRTIWNAYVTKSFLRDRSLALKLECSDILNQRSQNGVFQSTTDRSWFYGTCVGRFFMLHAIYRFSTKKN